MIQAQKNTLSLLSKQLTAEKSGKLDDTIGRQMDLQLNRLDLSANKVGCTLSDSSTIINKENILKETTYETCKHISYMNYLLAYYSDNANVLGLDNPNTNTNYTQSFPVQEISQKMNRTQQLINDEISHTYKVFPLAVSAYNEYEDNFPLHFILEVIRADVVLLRQKIYEDIMPIAQVGYKIINAMSK